MAAAPQELEIDINPVKSEKVVGILKCAASKVTGFCEANVTFCHYFDFQVTYNFFRFNRICVIFQLLRRGCLYYRDFARFFSLLRRNLGRSCTIVILTQFFSRACGAAACTILIFLWFSLLRHNLWQHCTIVILAQFFIAPAARLSYQCNIGFIFISPFMALYYSVSVSNFSRLRRGNNF